MKIATLILALGTLFSTASFAQTFGIKSDAKFLTCDFGKMFNPSEQMAKITKSAKPVARCSLTDDDGNLQSYEIAFFGVKFTTDSAAFSQSPEMKLHCSSEKLAGVYAYAGFPMGFQTQNLRKMPDFDKVAQDRSDGGRCALEYSSAITGVEASKGESMMVLLPVAAK